MRLYLLPIVSACALLGCGKPQPEASATVHGQVTFQGEPLAGGLIVFAPNHQLGNDGPAYSAKLDNDGKYRLEDAGHASIQPGAYRVAIADAPQRLSGDGTPFPKALRRPDLSGLERTVVAERENIINFEIEVAR